MRIVQRILGNANEFDQEAVARQVESSLADGEFRRVLSRAILR